MAPKFLAPPEHARKPKRSYDRKPKKRQGLPPIAPEDRALFDQCREIRDRYADGVPLSAEDRKVVLQALRKHPKGRDKFGAGVQAVMVSKFVGDSRCFFVVRADGTAEDFSLRKCFWSLPGQGSGMRLEMDAWDYAGIVGRFRAWLKARRS